MPRRILKGIVVSDKQDKTIMVSVQTRYKHPLYKKISNRSKKYAAHDPENHYSVGDNVSIIEHRPISKSKSWVVHK
ncbi:MAG: 30S ribosomal protein S17 [Rickettsiaceae bacterium]